MGNDYMTSTVSSHMLISEITLALFEDSGWYMPDYSQAEDMWWGKNRGCDFVYPGTEWDYRGYDDPRNRPKPFVDKAGRR